MGREESINTMMKGMTLQMLALTLACCAVSCYAVPPRFFTFNEEKCEVRWYYLEVKRSNVSTSGMVDVYICAVARISEDESLHGSRAVYKFTENKSGGSTMARLNYFREKAPEEARKIKNDK